MRKIIISVIIALISCVTCSAAQFNIDDMNKIPLENVKTNFMKLYKTRWEIFGADGKLRQAIDKAFNENTKNLMRGTKGLQLGLNFNSIITKIQRSIEFNFSSQYEQFLQELELVWSEQLRNEILIFYQRNNYELSFELENNPMTQAYLRRDYDSVTEDKGSDIMKSISGELAAKYPDIRFTGAKFIGGGMILLARKYLESYVTKLLMRKFTGSAAGKLASSIVPITGLAMILWSAWDIYSMANEAEGVLREKFYDLNHSMYYQEVPLIYWEGIEAYVRDAFIFAYDKLILNVNKGIELENTPAIRDFKYGLSPLEQRFYSDRVALIQLMTEEDNYALSEIIINLGKYIKSADIQEFDKLVIMLRELGLNTLLGWLKLAGDKECYRLYDSLPLSAWTKFNQDEDSLRIFLSLAKNLTPQQCKKACELRKEKLLWVIDELPEKFMYDLFTDNYDKFYIEQEISRLSGIQDKESRKPWQF
ncbi:MAG: hypothetical protein IJP48_03575 [Synergistaceae bacterium]|nr:hypothetical protein [Synergistaceae bacterium]